MGWIRTYTTYVTIYARVVVQAWREVLCIMMDRALNIIKNMNYDVGKRLSRPKIHDERLP